MNNKKLFSCYP